jgi:methanethiol S-methyltransferase
LELVLSTLILVFNLVAFAVNHSLTASLPFKRLIMRFLGFKVEALYLPVYSFISLLTLSPLAYLLYKFSGRILYRISSPWRWLMVGGQLIAAILAPKVFLMHPLDSNYVHSFLHQGLLKRLHWTSGVFTNG